MFLKTMNTEFSEIDIWFTDQNNNALEIVNVNISLIINTSSLRSKELVSATLKTKV